MNHYINGQWISGQGGSFRSVNPANNTLIWEGRMASEDEVAEAYQAARAAFSKWALLEVPERAHYLQSFAKEVRASHAELTRIIASETGKPLWEAQTEVNSVIAKVDLSIKAYFERTPAREIPLQDAMGHVRYKPHGVVAVLGPFNFPAHLSNGHIVPALLAGNTVVYKPSELAPKVAELIIECWHKSNLPPGVINCVQGGIGTAQHLLREDIQGVYFTGSYATGLKIHEQFASKPEVILALEMGGNNPLILDKVSDLKSALYLTLLSTLITSGQRCSCARRVFIPDNQQGDEFISRFLNLCQTIRIGEYTAEPEPFMGPVIHYEHALSHLEAQEKLRQSGGKSLLMMKLLEDKTGFLSPGVIDMSAVNNPADQEIFAPLVQIYRYHDFDEALLKANQTRYGLAAALLSDSFEHYSQFYQTMRAGVINWNKPTTGASSHLPFGGVGHSGNHRPSAFFAADYCAYPIASMEQPVLSMPDTILPGISLT
ncbi:succinylglutamate-semialdehyde dehydrogenase [Legionella londiniensis]|uniref:N-succinylglutamate 5-semialdehyde dehydrogenase n=1 Tax=Legionella londiniensis TaxID=45068 RepID=A0A0W0VLT5_9GAMM|nr:succinylglutamate-semialdehyde dehydrogenase [Legionella londiniensis]KTD21104.1 succinylglutamic-5-semialdehyde dehydrogenase [Legionella londiniensis]STX93126.1 succinylglutamic-5-semialdehyde dehydrogenase [Legionella londiniensis]